MWELGHKEGWALKIDAFELWYWRRLLSAPWTARRSTQSMLKETSPEYSLEGLKIKWRSSTLATWCKELTHWKIPWCWERFKAGGEGDDRGRDGWMASLTQWTWVWVDSGSWWWTGRPSALQSMGLRRVGHDWVTQWTAAYQAPLSMGFARHKGDANQPQWDITPHQSKWPLSEKANKN